MAYPTLAQWNTNGSNIYYNGPGNVGIGITAPVGKFQVYGGNAYLWGLNLGYGTNPAVLTTDDNSKALSLQINGTEYARLHNNGNFGIGTTTPGEKLSVSGNVQLSGQIYWNWPNRTIEQVVQPDGTSIVMRFRNSMYTSDQNPNGGFDFTDPGGGSVLRIVNGSVGIAGIVPTEKLQVNGSAYTSTESAGFIADVAGQKRVGLIKYFGREAGIWRTATQKFEIGRVDVASLPGTPSVFTTDFYVGGDGNIGIGTNDPKGYRLAVNGDAIFTKIKVKAYSTWPDYVFQKAYVLQPLCEVEQFIQQYQRLPGMPSAAEVEKNGIDLGDNQSALLRKIEELTLYVIDINKKNEALQKQVNDLNAAFVKMQKDTCR